jgi:hypothetical protein
MTSSRLHRLFGERLVGLDGATDRAALKPDERKPASPVPDPPVDLLEAFREELVMRGLRVRTRKVYLAHVRAFLRWSELSAASREDVPDDVPRPDAARVAGRARPYLAYLVEERNASRSYHTQAVSALKILFQGVLRSPDLAQAITRPKREKRLPSVL